MRHLFVALFSLVVLASFKETHLNIVATIDIETIDPTALAQLKTNRSFAWWSQLGDTLVVGGHSVEMIKAGVSFKSVWPGLEAQNLAIVIGGHSQDIPDQTKIITRSGRIVLVTKSKHLASNHHMKVIDFEKNTVYVASGRHMPLRAAISSKSKDKIKDIMDEVDPVRWFGDVATLTNWNRHISSVDIVSARDWFINEFTALNPSSVIAQKFYVRGHDAWNVITTFNESLTNDIYIVGGHYDSISENVAVAAPGAEDNASGAAGVLELARVFANKKTTATLIFIVFSGEEQGLVGSKSYVQKLPQATRPRIKGMINMDMIGYSVDQSEDVLLETAGKFRQLSEIFAASAAMVPGLRYFTSFNPFGSDHMPFIDNNIPAILTIDHDWQSYPAYHSTRDQIDKISREMGAAILKMNAAALAQMTELSR
jgi:hypothetical protein